MGRDVRRHFRLPVPREHVFAALVSDRRRRAGFPSLMFTPLRPAFSGQARHESLAESERTATETPGFRQSGPDERSAAKANYGRAQTSRFTPEPETSSGPFASCLYFVGTSAQTTSGALRSPQGRDGIPQTLGG